MDRVAVCIIIAIIIVLAVCAVCFIRCGRDREPYTASTVMKKFISADAKSLEGVPDDGTFVLVRVEPDTEATLFSDIVDMGAWSCPNGEDGDCTGNLAFVVPPDEFREPFDAAAVEYMREKLNLQASVTIPVTVSLKPPPLRGTYLLARLDDGGEFALLPNVAEFVPDSSGCFVEGEECTGTATYVGERPGEFRLVQTLENDPGGVVVKHQSVSISSTAVIFGTVYSTIDGKEVGIYEKTASGTWRSSPDHLIEESNTNNFGWSVSIDGDSAMVGAPSEEVFVYQKIPGGGWIKDTTYTDPINPPPGGKFGFSVAVRNYRALIGNPSDTQSVIPIPLGAFVSSTTPDGWSPLVPIQTPQIIPGSLFGQSVAITDDGIIIIGNPNEETTGGNVGTAYGYAYEDEQNVSLFQLRGTMEGGEFGWSVAIDGDHAIIGAPGEGKAYIYQKNSNNEWIAPPLIATLQGELYDHEFGRTVSLSGTTAMVGTGLGKVYFYRNEGMGEWSQTDALDFPDSQESSLSIAIKGSSAIVGVLSPQNTAAAYIYERTPPDPT